MHRQGKAGIQNSVLSRDCSSRVDIRVSRVCSISGLCMILQTYGSFSIGVWLSWLLELRPSLPKTPLRAESIFSPMLRAPEPSLEMKPWPLLSLNELEATDNCSDLSLLDPLSSSRGIALYPSCRSAECVLILPMPIWRQD